MLISHRKKFIYAKTSKTASTSLKVYFEPYCFEEGKWETQRTFPQDMHENEFGIVGSRGIKRNGKRNRDHKWWGICPP